jgi:putative transposase
MRHPTQPQNCLDRSRSTYYYQPRPESAENLRLLRQLDRLYLKCPFFGSRKMAVELDMNSNRIQRLIRILGIEALYPKPNLSRPAPGHEVYPYLLRGVSIERPNHVWSTDITYIPMRGGFLYLVAVMDWFSRFVLSWELSNTLETGFCLAALQAAFRFGQPEIWNSDQGSQFTSADFLAPLKQRGVLISMDGRGRALDNVFIERLWRSLKYDLIYPGDFATGLELFPALETTCTSTITSARTRRSATERRQICFRTHPEGKGRCHDGGRCPPNPLGFIAFVFQNGWFFLYCTRHLPYNRNA